MIQRALFYLTYPLIMIYAPLYSRSRVVIVHDGEFLAVKARFGDFRWHLPGGGVKRGETRKAAAVREIQEELGIELTENDLKSLRPYGFYRNQGLFYRGEVFLTKLSDKKLDFERNSEILEAAWLPIDPNQPRIGKIVEDSLKRIYVVKP